MREKMILAAVDYIGSNSFEESLDAMLRLLEAGIEQVELCDAQDGWYKIHVSELPYMGNKSARLVCDARFVE